MSEKKSKALALELMDDLLDDKKSEEKSKAKKAPEPSGKSKAKTPESTVAPEPAFDFSLSHPESSMTDDTVELSSVLESPQMEESGPISEDDRTIRIPESKVMSIPQAAHSVPQETEKRARATVGRFGGYRSGGSMSATEAALAQSESLRIAQSRLLELEGEIERLRTQNEELAAAAETLRRRKDELLAANQRRDSDYQNAVSTFEQEKAILSESKEAVQRDLETAKNKSEELELRISSNIQKIRVRERELENRLELVKMESAAIIRSKDEMILDLKRQIDQLNLELNNYRSKNQELNRLTGDKQEMLRRTVKALRLALSMLEGEEEAPNKPPLRKAK